jgi:hypothetical protein
LTEDGNVEISGRDLRGYAGSSTDNFRAKNGPMRRLALATLWLAMLLAGCGGSLRGDASAGPNPGSGFYGAPNIDIGRINP